MGELRWPCRRERSRVSQPPTPRDSPLPMMADGALIPGTRRSSKLEGSTILSTGTRVAAASALLVQTARQLTVLHKLFALLDEKPVALRKIGKASSSEWSGAVFACSSHSMALPMYSATVRMEQSHAQARFSDNALMQARRINSAMASEIDDPPRDNLSAAHVSGKYLEIGTGQLECG